MHNVNIIEKGTSLENASRAMILLHGRGGTADDIMSISDYFSGKSWFFTAPQAEGYEWYPHSFMAPAQMNEPWLDDAVGLVKNLIDNVAEKIPREKIFILGFSQGACLAAETAARYADRYGGIFILTGGLAGEVVDPGKYSGDFKGTKVYISNSDADPHIPLSRSVETRDLLKEMGGDVLLDVFPGKAHSVDLRELDNARKFILDCQ